MITLPQGYVFACQVSDLPPRGRKVLQMGDTSVIIVACEAGLFAVENRCPQTSRPIARGEVLDGSITSPSTGARYCLKTGRYLDGGQLALSHWLTVFPLQIIDNAVYVRLPD